MEIRLRLFTTERKTQFDEQEAKSDKLSIWSKSGYVTNRGFNGCVK